MFFEVARRLARRELRKEREKRELNGSNGNGGNGKGVGTEENSLLLQEESERDGSGRDLQYYHSKFKPPPLGETVQSSDHR